MNLKELTADKLVALYQRRELSVTEAISGVFEEIERTDRNVRAFLTLCKDTAQEDARRIDAKIAAGDSLGPLSGVPVAIKDNMTLRDVPTLTVFPADRAVDRLLQFPRGWPSLRWDRIPVDLSAHRRRFAASSA